MDKVKQPKTNEFSNTNEEREILSWQAPERSLRKRDKDFWITVLSTYFLTSIILIFAKETFLVFAIGAAIFLYYALTTVEPQIIINKITNRGIYFGSIFYDWRDLANFWFGKSGEREALFFETYLRFPRQVSLIIEAKDKDKLKDLVVKKLPLVKQEPTFIDKASKWLMEKLPLEDKKN